MNERGRRICAILFGFTWVFTMAGIWCVGQIICQAVLGDIPDNDQGLTFIIIAAFGLVIGCLGCFYSPYLLNGPRLPPPYV